MNIPIRRLIYKKNPYCITAHLQKYIQKSLKDDSNAKYELADKYKREERSSPKPLLIVYKTNLTMNIGRTPTSAAKL